MAEGRAQCGIARICAKIVKTQVVLVEMQNTPERLVRRGRSMVESLEGGRGGAEYFETKNTLVFVHKLM